MVERQEDVLFWREAREQLDRLKADPDAWQDYLAEMTEWDDVPNEILDAEPPYDDHRVDRGSAR